MDLQGKKFYNILKGLKIDTITKELIDLLVAKEIIVKENVQNKFEVPDYLYSQQHHNNINKENSTDLVGTIIFDKVEYIINELVIEEIYTSMEDMINQSKVEVKRDITEIEIELHGIIRNDGKLKYLHKKHFSIVTEFKRNNMSLLYLEKNVLEGRNLWKEFFSILLRYNHDDLIISYLTNDCALSFNDIEVFNDWVNYYRIELLSDFCKEKINELQNLNDSKNIKNSPSLSDLIFTEDGEDIFNFINSQYLGKRNKAFYSYLYFYLQSKSKLVNNLKKDSTTYRSYVTKNFLAGNFSKIITSNAFKQEQKTNIFLIFDNLMKSYSVYSEGKLNKND